MGYDADHLPALPKFCEWVVPYLEDPILRAPHDTLILALNLTGASPQGIEQTFSVIRTWPVKPESHRSFVRFGI
jgi:hypothetical protein